MEIVLENIGRHFNRDWVFRNLNYKFEIGNSYAILGANGSGKSTLMQLIAGSLSPSVGQVYYYQKRQLFASKLNIEADVQASPENVATSRKPIQDAVFQHIAWAAPCLELIEEFTLEELIKFHFRFKKCVIGFDVVSIIELLDMRKYRRGVLQYFSSGMKQKIKLALAFLSDTAILLLDEPSTNLDEQGRSWYLSLVQQFSMDRLMIICSNQEQEYACCKHHLCIADYK